MNCFELGESKCQRHEVPSVHISGFASLNLATPNLLMGDLNECKKINKHTHKKKKKGLYHL